MTFKNLTIDANLDCEIEGKKIRLRTKGHTLSVEVPDVATAVRLYRLSSPRGSHLKKLRKFNRAIVGSAMQVELFVGSKKMLSLGKDEQSLILQMMLLPFMAPSVLASLLQGDSARR